LAKLSSLRDYNRSCRLLQKYHNDFAADLTRVSYETGLNQRFTRDYLQDPESIGDLFRSVQLTGVSMNLTQSSETCSGSEHVGQRGLDEFLTRYNKAPGRGRGIPPLTHGQAVALTTLVTLHLQSQASKATAIREIAARIGLRFRVTDLGIPARVLQCSL